MNDIKPTEKKNSIFKARILILILPLVLIIALVAVNSVYSTPKSMEAKFYDLNNNEVYMTDFKGKTLIVEFMATWCTVCKQVTHEISRVLSENELPDVVFFSVTIDPVHDSPEVINNYISQNKLNKFVDEGKWVFLRDLDEEHKLYGVTGVPEIFLLNKNLDIVDKQVGLIRGAEILEWISNIN